MHKMVKMVKFTLFVFYHMFVKQQRYSDSRSLTSKKLLFLVATVIFGFLSIFKKSQASSPYEALNPCASRGVMGFEAPCPDEVDTYGFL